jgi:1-acyl-sn-glycerol-3-phosphate acyltransferase
VTPELNHGADSPLVSKDGFVSEDRLAIVGIGCRFPGGADKPEKFWNLLKQGFDAVTEAPASRGGLNELFDPDPRKPGRVYTRWGGFLDHVDLFDAHFFGISPREASRIDPQHRLLLELVWEACEDAGLPPTSLAGTRTAVFVGVSTHDYGDMQMYPAHRHEIDLYSNSGSATSIAANRISYIYDLRGPSVAVDTACSSALTAVHLAAQSFRTGDCNLAIVGGVQMFLTPELTIGFCKASMLSRDGKCRAFDAAANGYVRGEGGGVVILKPLRTALTDGDPIYAVIRSTAVNQDGHTSGMTVPNRASQQAMLEEALKKASLRAIDVQYVEAHGTGTPVGDPIEAAALGGAMSQGRNDGEFCAIGSVKTNIGHLEAASGIAGLIKTALALKHRQIPASLHFKSSKDTIDLQALRLRVVTSLEAWPHSDGPAIAGVNSFGFGGANAHVLMQEPPRISAVESSDAEDDSGTPELLVVSARSAEALNCMAQAYADFLGSADSPMLADVCSTAALRRSHNDHRLAIVSQNKSELAECLSASALGEKRLNTVSGRIAGTEPPKIAFVFSGLGPQWWAMGRQLLRDEPVFLREIERCDASLRKCSDWRLLEELSADEEVSRVAAAEFSQIGNFALEVALAALWYSYGITPSALIGHSGGAMAAAYLAGVHDLDDAIRLCYHRSRLMGRAQNTGRMLAVGLPWEEVAELARGKEDQVWLAAVNGPSSITLAGYEDSLEQIFATLQEKQMFARFLPITIAYHGPAMDSIKDEFLASMSDLRASRARIPLVSDTTGAHLEGNECDAGYWWQTIRRPIVFAQGIDQLIADGMQHFLEIGPHPVLASSIVDCMKARQATGLVLPSIRRKENERGVMLRSLGALYTAGCSPNWAAVQPAKGRLAALPGYTWQRERHWFEPIVAASSGARMDLPGRKAGDHPLLGARTRSARPSWEGLIGDVDTEYLRDHVVQDSIVFPGAGYVELALAAAETIEGGVATRLRNVEFIRPLLLSEGEATAIQLASDAERGSFEIYSSNAGSATSWVCHARGAIDRLNRREEVTVDLQDLQRRISDEIKPEDFYGGLAERNLRYGPAFRGVQRLWVNDRQALGLISGAELTDVDKYSVHPALLDAAFQLLVGAARTDASLASDRRLFLPTQIREALFYQKPGQTFWASARLNRVDELTVNGDIRIFDARGVICAEVLGLEARLVDSAGGGARDSIDQWLYEYRWELKAREFSEISGAVQGSAFNVVELKPILRKIGLRADAQSVESRWHTYYEEVEGRLNALATAYVVETLSKLGCGWRSGATLDLKSFGMSAESGWRQSLARQFFVMLENAGLVRQSTQTGRWEATGAALPQSSLQLAQALLRDFPNHRLDIDLLGRCGPRLAEVLDGRCDGRDILLNEEGLDFLEEFYASSPASAFYNALAADLVTALALSCDATSRLRILEVGAGTGGTTSHILPRLDANQCSYVFTDVSAVFLERARSRFAPYPFLTTKSLDAAKDLKAQGFQPSSFDLIIGANVLHATPDLEQSIKHLRELLAPGGVLLLLEITRHPYWLDIVFGLMEGWWKFEDRSLRPQHPLMTSGKWTALLEKCGLEQTATVADTIATGESAQSLLLARRPTEQISTAVPVTTTQQEKRWLIFADRRGVGAKLAGVLRARGFESTVVYAGGKYERIGVNEFRVQPNSAEDVTHLVEDLQGVLLRVEGVAYLWSLDESEPAIAAAEENLGAGAQGLGCVSLLVILRRLILASDLKGKTLVTVTAGAQSTSATEEIALWQSPIWGFGRVLLKELPGLRCRMIDLSSDCSQREIAFLAEEILSDDRAGAEEEIALRSGERFVHRLRPTNLAAIADAVPAAVAGVEDGWNAEIATTGSIDSLVFKRSERPQPGPHEIEISVSAASLNFRDVVLAMGIVPGLESDNTFGKKQIGSDLAGTVTRCGSQVTNVKEGDVVLGIASGTFASYALTNAALVARVPPALSLEQAAAVPVAFVTAWYALKHLARLKAGETVLIHAASGGVGLAAIQVAKLVGAKVFASAGSVTKRSYLQSMGVADVFDSRSLAFAEEIRERTGGEGVDIVLNSLAGEALQAGIGLLAPYGRFVELGKSDIYQNHRVELAPFKKNLSLFAVDLDRMSLEKPDEVGEMLREVVDQLASGALAPLPHTSFEMRKLADAMRFMAQAKHIGKVCITNGDPVEVRPSVPENPAIRADATYLITGGLGGLGLVVARWLLECGARAIMLLGRSDPSAEVKETIAGLRSGGARVEALRGDVSNDRDVAEVLGFVRDTLPPLRGIFHAAMVLEDTPIAALEADGFNRVMAPKVAGAWNLHIQTLGEPLDFFVSFSSITSLLGNPGQANYAAANAFLDSFAVYRRSHGLPATTINWGVISGSGYVARHQEIGDHLTKQGYFSFTPEQAIEVLSALMRHDAGQIMAARIDWKKLGESNPQATASNRVRHLVPSGTPGEQPGSGSIRLLLENEIAANRQHRVEEYLREQVGKLLGASPTSLETDRSIDELGVDSLIAAELTVVLQRDLDVEVSGNKLLAVGDLQSLGAYVLGLLRLDSAADSARTSAVPSMTADVPTSNPLVHDPMAAGRQQSEQKSEFPRPDTAEAVPTTALSRSIDTAPKQTRISRTEANGLTEADVSVHASASPRKTDYSSLNYSDWSASQKLVRGFASTCFRVLSHIKTQGFENIPKSGPCVIAVNHLSMTDVPLLLTLLQRRAIILANEKLRGSRVLDWLVSDLGQAIYITPNEVDGPSMRCALDVLRAGGLLALAPEGTRSKTGGLLRGRTGVAFLATQANVPVIPVAAWGQEKWRQVKSLKRVQINVRAGEPLHLPSGPASPRLLRQYTDTIMLALADLLPREYRGVYAGATAAAATDDVREEIRQSA